MYKTLHLVAEFYHLTYNRKTKGAKVTKIISWCPSQPPFITLNTYGSSKNNLGNVGGGGEHINLEIDSQIVLNWLTTYGVLALELSVLILDCRVLLRQEWIILPRHVFRE